MCGFAAQLAARHEAVEHRISVSFPVQHADRATMEEGSGALYNVTNSSTVLSGIVLGRTTAAFSILFFIIGLPWNILVIAIILKKMLFTKPSGMLLLNLAIANFLVCLLMMPLWAVLGLIAGGETPEELLTLDKVCQTAFLQILFLTATIYTVALMAVDRAIYLAKPLSYDSIVTPWRMFIAIVIVWLSCTAVSLPPLFGFGQLGYSTSMGGCAPDLRNPSDHSVYYFLVSSFFAAVGTLTQLFGCGYIIYITRKALLMKLHRIVGTRKELDNQVSSDGLRNYTKSQIQLVKVFGAIFSTSFITLLPLIAVGIATPILGSGDSIARPILYTVGLISVLAKSVIHPILEAYMTRETRTVISRITSKFTRWKTSKRTARQSMKSIL